MYCWHPSIGYGHMGKQGGTESGPKMFHGEERRRAARFHVCRDTLVYNQDSFAEILDISFGGLACRRHVGMVDGPEVISDL